MGFFFGLDSETYDRQYSDIELVKRASNFFLPHRKKLIIISFLILLNAGISTLIPMTVSYSFDQFKLADQASLYIYLLALLVSLLGVAIWGVNWTRRRMTSQVVGDVVPDFRNSAFRQTMEHDLSFFDKFSSGRIVSRITSDTREFGQLVVIITDIIAQLIQAIILFIVLSIIQFKLSVWVLLFMPFIFLFATAFRKFARITTRRGMQAMANVNAAIKQTISGINVAKNFAQEESIYSEFIESNQTSFRVNVVRGFVLSLVFPSLNTIAGIATALLVFYGGKSVIAGAITLGGWFLFLLSLDRFFFPIMNLSAFWAQVQSGLSACERVFGLMDAPMKVTQQASIVLDNIRGEISFKDVTFSYVENEMVYEQFSLRIDEKESVAFVGQTGAGKSSAAKLIARLYEYQDGTIKIDGTDIRDIDLNVYRSQLGIVPQTPFLFAGTVRENIRYGFPNANDGEVKLLAQSIGAGEWLHALANGLDTEVGERGSWLSMGQRQLIALLRVMIQKPAIFILDEATASIDPFTEMQIQEALKTIMSMTTSVIIAHRLSTIKAADRIIVLDDGSIIEQGTHDELLDKQSNYAHLYNTFFRHQSIGYIENVKKTSIKGMS